MFRPWDVLPAVAFKLVNFIKSNYRNKLLEIRITVYIHESELHFISITCRLERKRTTATEKR